MFPTHLSFVCDFQGGGSHLEFFLKKVTLPGIPSEL